uniref:Uncharacterized protein n=1 Tax=Calcidiscus leptoporus TaxID=127549 RepID=A0A7S0IP23_9EUKA
MLGARRAIGRDRPFLTAEVHLGVPTAREVVSLLDSFNYTSFVVQEVCGMSINCRNLLSIPNEDIARVRGSPTLDLAVRGEMLVAANATLIGGAAYTRGRMIAYTRGQMNAKHGGVQSNRVRSWWEEPAVKFPPPDVLDVSKYDHAVFVTRSGKM